MPTWRLVLVAGPLMLFAVVGAATVVLILVLRRPQRRAYGPDDAPSPLSTRTWIQVNFGVPRAACPPVFRP